MPRVLAMSIARTDDSPPSNERCPQKTTIAMQVHYSPTTAVVIVPSFIPALREDDRYSRR